MAITAPTRTDGEYAAVTPLGINSSLQLLTMNGTTNVTITLTLGTYLVYLASADPTLVCYGSFGGAPTLPVSAAAATNDMQTFFAGQIGFLYADAGDLTYNVKLTAAGTPTLFLQKIHN